MIKLQLKALVAAAAALGLSACATSREFGLAPEVEVAQLSELPAPSTPSAYTIGRQETLEITVVGAETLSGTFLTDSEGYLSYPLVGDILVVGRTPSQVSRMITEGLRGKYVVDPQVRVRPTAIPALSISVGGEVESPGTFPAATSQSLIRAINNAGGLTEYAKNDDVLILRTVDGQKYVGLYNLQAIQRGNYTDPMLYPEDIVMVGDSPARRRFDTFLQIFSLVSSSIVLIDRTTR